MAASTRSVSRAEAAVLSRVVQPQAEEPTAKSRTSAPPHCIELTANEIRLLKCLAAGWSSVQIGRHTYRSEKTVRNQLTCIYNKLGAANRAEAVAKFLSRSDEGHAWRRSV